MPTVHVTIKNLPQIRAAFGKAPRLMVKKLDDAIKKSAFLIERESKTRTPVLTGRLRASHQTTYAPLQATIEPTAEYAIYVHEGTRFMRARPFLLEGVQAAEKSVQKFFTDAVKEALDEVARDSQ